MKLSLVTLILQQASIAQQTAQIERTTQLHTSRIGEEIQWQIKSQILALVRMADRWQIRGKTPRPEWQADANNYLKDCKGYQAIEWVDATFSVRWRVPQAENQVGQNLDVKLEARRRTALEAAFKQRQPTVTRSLELIPSGSGFGVAIPLFPKGKFDGFIFGVFRTQQLLDAIINSLETQQTIWKGYSITIYDAQEEIYHRRGSNKSHQRQGQEEKWNREVIIKIDDLTWRMQIWPDTETIAAQQSLLPNAILASGLVTSWLLALTIYFLLMIRRHAHATELANQELERQIRDREQTEEALSRLSRQNELILNAVGEGIFGLDRNLKITFVNAAAAKMLGYPVEELVGMPMPAIVCKSLKDSEKNGLENGFCCSGTKCSIARTLEEGSVHQVSDRAFCRKDGTSFPVEYVSTPILENSQIVGAVVAFKDISDRLAMERMKDEFISVVSHELRTPLTSIRGAVGLLAGGLGSASPEKAQRMLDIAIANTDRLGRLIEDILALERIESGQLTQNKQLCNSATLMLHSVESVQLLARKANVEISVLPIEVPLWGEPNLLLQTLTNLLSNAIKFSPPGATVWLSGEKRGEQILFKIQDQGRGIPPDKLELIFERFQQVDASDSRAHGGTGLGLAICRCIVQQHGGSIWADSHPGVGSNFFFTLPIVKELPVMEKLFSH